MSNNFWTKQEEYEDLCVSKKLSSQTAYNILKEELDKVTKSTLHPSMPKGEKLKAKFIPGVEIAKSVEKNIEILKEKADREAPLYYPIPMRIPTGPNTFKFVLVGGKK